MVPAAFTYVRVDSYEAAVAALSEYGEDARVLAGGQSLVPMLNLRLARPSVLVDINALDGEVPSLRRDGMLALPAMTRHQAVIDSPLVRTHCPLLSTAVAHVGNVRVRTRGTVGGSLAQADPTAEISCVALALGADVVALGPQGERTIPVRELFVTYLTTVLRADEVVTEVLVPGIGKRQGWSFHEMVRRAADFATVGVAATVTVAEDGRTVRDAQLALVGVDQRPVMAASQPLSTLVDRDPTSADLAAVADGIADATDPETDVHASGWYRKQLVAVLSARALAESLTRARENR